MNEKMQEILCQHSAENIGEGGTPTAGDSALLRKATSSESLLSTMRHGKKGVARKPDVGQGGACQPWQHFDAGFLSFQDSELIYVYV